MTAYRLGDRVPVLPDEDEYWIAPTASVIGDVILKKNASVWWGAVVRGDNEPIIIGDSSNVQNNAVLHTDPGSPLTIGANVTVGPRAVLHGCTIGDGALIGIGAIVLDGAKIGKNCLVGDGALVTLGKEFPDNVMILGSPGRVVGELGPEQAARMSATALQFVEDWKRLRAQLAPA